MTSTRWRDVVPSDPWKTAQNAFDRNRGATRKPDHSLKQWIARSRDIPSSFGAIDAFGFPSGRAAPKYRRMARNVTATSRYNARERLSRRHRLRPVHQRRWKDGCYRCCWRIGCRRCDLRRFDRWWIGRRRRLNGRAQHRSPDGHRGAGCGSNERQRLQVQDKTAQSEAQQASAEAGEQLTQAQASVAAQLAKATQLRGALDAKTAELAALDVKYNELLGKLSEATAAPPEPVMVTLTDEQKRLRDELVAKGEAAAKALRLSTPAGNNAVEFFRSALEMTRTAKALGPRQRRYCYINLAKRNNCQKAKDYLPRAAALVPSRPCCGRLTSFEGCGVGPSDFAFRDSLTDGGTGRFGYRSGWRVSWAAPWQADADNPCTESHWQSLPLGLTEVTFDDTTNCRGNRTRETNDGKKVVVRSP